MTRHDHPCVLTCNIAIDITVTPLKWELGPVSQSAMNINNCSYDSARLKAVQSAVVCGLLAMHHKQIQLSLILFLIYYSVDAPLTQNKTESVISCSTVHVFSDLCFNHFLTRLKQETD